QDLLGRDDDAAWVPGGAEQLRKKVVVAGAVLDDQPGLGDGDGVGDVRLIQVRFGGRAGQDRGDPDVAATDLRRDVPPEILPRDDPHHPRNRRGLRAAAPRQGGRGHAEDGEDGQYARHAGHSSRSSVPRAHLSFLEKICRKNWNTFSASRKIDAAISGAESISFERRSRWKSDIVRPAKITSPRIE